MAEKICLDTDIVITILKGDKPGEDIINKLLNYEIFITSITVFELFLRQTNLEIIEEFIQNLNILSLNEISAKKASELHKSLEKKGSIIDLRDIFISAICLNNNVKLATMNRKHFERIPGLQLESI